MIESQCNHVFGDTNGEDIECEWPALHDKVVYDGVLYEHSAPTKGVWWNNGALKADHYDAQPARCGYARTGVQCVYRLHHAPIATLDGETFEHGDPVRGMFWNELKPFNANAYAKAEPVKGQPEELVDHPQHYGGDDDPYETIKVIEAWELDFHLGNTVKYISRVGKKAGTTPRIDLEKARWYLNRAIEMMGD